MATPTEPKPMIGDLVTLTMDTINVRTTRFRNFVIVVVVISLISIAWAGMQKSWLPIGGLLSLVPAWGIFLYLDTRMIDQWQQQILKMWTQETLDIGIFSETIATIRMIPKRTLEGMLGTLPGNKNASDSGNISPDIRKALAMTLQTINRCQNDRTAFFTLAASLGLASLAFVIIQWSWMPLLGFISVFPVIGMGKWRSHYRLRKWEQRIIEKQQQEGWDTRTFIEIAHQLDWGAVSDNKKRHLLDSLRMVFE